MSNRKRWFRMDCGNGCCGRNFYTKEERIKFLKDYKTSLESEAKGVGERIKELEKNN